MNINVEWEKNIESLESVENVKGFPDKMGAYHVSNISCPGCDKSVLYGVDVKNYKAQFEDISYPVKSMLLCPVCRTIYALGKSADVDYCLASKQYNSLRFSIMMDNIARFKVKMK